MPPRTARAAVVSIISATLVVALLPATAAVQAVANPATAVFFNELHYDNDGTDTGEAIEIAAPAGTDLTGWSIVLYNGNGGAPYDTDPLGGVVADQADGYGTVVVNYPSNGIQNGSPDGLALVDVGGDVVQFLSYEGAFTAVGGPADGLGSTDIGVSETGGEPAGQSLALTGAGTTYGAFAWSPPAASSFGQVNPGQSFSTTGPIATCPEQLVTPAGIATSADVSAMDADSNVTTIAATVSPPEAGISVTNDGEGAGSLNVADTVAVGTYEVVIEFGTDDDPPQTTACTVGVVVEGEAPPPAVTLISTIQGDGSASPIAGAEVTAEGVVTSRFERDDVLDGFFLQEEETDADGSAATSEGVFVFCRFQCPAELAVGDLVAVRGRVAEFFEMTQIDASPAGNGQITPISSGNPLPAAAPVELPAAGSTRDLGTFESVEGMIATFPDRLVVSEFFELARYGQVVLTVDEQPYQFTHDHAPSVEGYAAFLTDLATRRIILDDDNNDQNDAIVGPAADEPYPYPSGGLAVDNRLRAGDSATGLTGVLHWSFAGQRGTDAWRIRPIQGREPTFQPASPAAEAPEDVGGSLRVAAFNVLNLFSTVDTTSSNDAGDCGPSGGLDCRGADSAAELTRQRDKIVAALTAMDAHVVGLIEIQNDDGQSTTDLVAALNAATSPGRYAAIDTGTIGTDAIKVALIYQPAVAVPVGPFDVLSSADDPRFIDTLNRPVLIQTFEQVATGERLTVAVNHLKSKGSDCDDIGDPDRGDGQANCPGTRTDAAQALADHLATDPTGSGDPDFMIIGDLNAYRREDPITALRAAGYTDLIELFVGDDAASFLFDGQLGYLDHALATASLVPQVTGVTEWSINAAEPPLYDYNDTVADAGEASFERKSAARELYLPDARRSSDHDPVLVGLDLDGTPATLTIGDALITTRRGGGGRLLLAAQVSGVESDACPTVGVAAEGVAAASVSTQPLGRTSRCLGTLPGGFVTYDRATGALRAIVALPAPFQLTDDTVRFDVTLDGETASAEVTGRRIGSIWTF